MAKRATNAQKKTVQNGHNIIQVTKPPKGAQRLSPGVYRITGNDKKNPKDEKNKGQVSGHDVSIRQTDADWRVVYGRTRVGGVITFIDTGRDKQSKAQLIVGSGDQGISYTAKTAGASGNDITIAHIVGFNVGTLSVNVSGNDITVNLKTSGFTVTSTANQVASAVRSSGAASALVHAAKAPESDGTGKAVALAKTNLTGGGGVWLHLIDTLACHRINTLDNVILDSNVVTFGHSPDPRWAIGSYNNHVFYTWAPGTSDQEAIPDLIAQLPDQWTDNHRQRGRAHGYMILKWNEAIFPNGFPDISYNLTGKLVYDPRTSTTIFTTNAALIIADYLCDSQIGLGFDRSSEIDLDALSDAADMCDELVTVAGGGTQPRYEINGSFEVSTTPQQILEDFARAIAGTISWTGEKWKIMPGAWREPVMDLTEAHIYSAISIQARNGTNERYNAVKGSFPDSANEFKKSDYPTVKNATYLSQDANVERVLDLDLNFTSTHQMAQRISKIYLEKSRQGIRVSFTGPLSLYPLEVEDVVTLTIERYGWNEKTFVVIDTTLHLSEGSNGAPVYEVSLILEETAEGIFDWANGEETTYDLAPNTTLGEPYDIDPPTSLTLESGTAQLDKRLDGSIWSRLKISWTEPADVFVTQGGSYEIQYKKTADSAWRTSAEIPGGVNYAYLLDVQDGAAYDVRIRSTNGVGAKSDWVEQTNYTIIGKTAPPSDVTGFVATVSDIGISFNWTAVTDIDIKDYEVREGTVWGSGDTVIGRTDSSAGVTSLLYEFYTAGTYNFMIKARDTTLNYSTNAATASVTILVPNPILAFTPDVIRNNVLLDWVEGLPSTLTVNEYNVYKGDTELEAVRIGTVFGTFHTYIEKYGGTFTYWIEAVDIGGNVSSRVSASATVAVSNDFYINADQMLIEDLTRTFFAVELDDSVFAPLGVVSPTLPFPYNPAPYYETWADHFSLRSWVDVQDAIDEGYITYLQPGSVLPFSSRIEFTHDFLVTFGSSFVDFSWLETALGTGAGTTVIPSIHVSPDNSTWVEYEGTRQVFADNFRYVKFILDVYVTDEFSLSEFSDFRAVLSLQRDEETQIITAVSTDTGGTVVTFTKDFIDVEDIQVSANSTTHAVAVYDYDFSIVPAQQTMKVLAFNSAGTRITKEVTCRIRGAVSGA